MKLRIVAVGAIRERPARELCDDYLARIRHYCSCEEIELRPQKKLNEALERSTRDFTVVALDERGDLLTSQELARRVEQLASRGKGQVAFLIGGADGLPRAALESAAARWSLTKLTLPHRLARVILAEQLYRAMTILRGEPYAR
ncbi:MAG TPA: 23S rRNA (pseudouridine(1915)-N(3))-methyltransferase RlmH [Polyangiaceae bacterium]|nr:23S rRNA (pseudouridine(1915)-N(3))-methyltransferase RlmH [Polyangiaceae bacterium]